MRRGKKPANCGVRCRSINFGPRRKRLPPDLGCTGPSQGQGRDRSGSEVLQGEGDAGSMHGRFPGLMFLDACRAGVGESMARCHAFEPRLGGTRDAGYALVTADWAAWAISWEVEGSVWDGPCSTEHMSWLLFGRVWANGASIEAMARITPSIPRGFPAYRRILDE